MTRLYLAQDFDGTKELVQAVKWTGGNFAELERFAGRQVKLVAGALEVADGFDGWETADLGDWVILGADGEAYLEMPDNFQKLYQPAGDGWAS